jgi:hypothetical protein
MNGDLLFQREEYHAWKYWEVFIVTVCVWIREKLALTMSTLENNTSNFCKAAGLAIHKP